MLEIVVAVVIGSILVVGPLAWRVQQDRSESRALATRAYVQSLVDRRLGGESFVSVQVTPRSLWSRGQVVVSVPGGWEWMLEDVWPVLLARVPRGFELVVRRGDEAPAPSRTLPARGNPPCTSGWPRSSRTRARRRAIGTST